jgi:mono/diheme cytochrome c family protein
MTLTTRIILLTIVCATAWTLGSGVGAESPAPASAQSAAAAPASVWDSAYTAEQVARGDTVYRQECGNCHGDGLGGGDMTPALVGGAFTSNWNDLTVGDLFERIRITMPLDRPGKLTRQQNADVIAFLLNANGWPAGKTELSRELATLKQIKIQATKPTGQP